MISCKLFSWCKLGLFDSLGKVLMVPDFKLEDRGQDSSKA